MTTEEAKLKLFKDKALLIHRDKYNYSNVKYKNNYTKVEIICNIHGSFWQRPQDHTKGRGCAQCGGSLKGTNKTHDARLHYLYNGTVKRNGEYTNALTKLSHVHTICGTIWDIKPNDLYSGHSCPTCGGTALKSNVKYLEELQIKHGGAIIAKEPYVTANTHILHQHVCGHLWKVKPGLILLGRGCPKCNLPSDKDVIYIWSIPGTLITKVGVTSNRLGLSRILNVAHEFSLKIKTTFEPIIHLIKEVDNATELEKQLLSMNTVLVVDIPKINGSTEFRIMTNKDITQAISYIHFYEEATRQTSTKDELL